MNKIRFKLAVGTTTDYNDRSIRASMTTHYAKLRDVYERAFRAPMPAGAPDPEKGGDRLWATIVCRADQFGVFIVLRENAGLMNSIKELEPWLINATPAAVDVSNN